MIRAVISSCSAGSILLALALAAAATVGAGAETVREMESSRGLVRITVVPLEAPGAPADPQPDPDSGRAAEVAADRVHPVEAIVDFTSLAEMSREAEAMLGIYYFDKAAREELNFPLKYSELRRYLRNHPLGYREGTLEERNVALMGDLAASLRIRMLTPAEMKGKP
jgi:hypothetical protein